MTYGRIGANRRNTMSKVSVKVALADAAALGGGETPPNDGGERPVTSGALG